MPVSRDTTIDLAQGVVDLYTGLEERIAAALAAEIRRDPDPSELAKLEAVRRLRDGAQRMLDHLESDASNRTYAAVAEAWARGGQAAIAEIAKTDRKPAWWENRGLIMRLLGRLIGADRRQANRDRDRLDRDIADLREALPGVDSINAVARELNDRRASAHAQILRWQDDVYRTVIGQAGLVDVLAGQQTRLKATQASLDRFLSKGVTGFTDSRGHRWSLASYIEMALRSGTARAAVESHMARLADADIDLVMVSDAPQECSLCLLPGTVVEGPIPTGRTRSEYTGDIVRIVTASGNDLSGTPDHPVLTARGWVALKDLAPGDQVVSHDRQQGYPGVVPDDVQVPALIEEAGEARLPVLLAGPTRRYLDKDVAYRKVRYVRSDGNLPDELDTALTEPVADHLLVSGIGLGGAFLGLDDLDLELLGARHTSGGVMHRVQHPGSLVRGGILPALKHSGGGEGRSFLRGETTHVRNDAMMIRSGLHASACEVVTDKAGTDTEGRPEHFGGLTGTVTRDQFGGLLVGELSGAASGQIDAARSQSCFDLGVADVEGGFELLDRLTGSISLDEIIDVSVSEYSGHVWDLSTEPRWYVANGIVTHNCRPWEGKILARSGPTGHIQVEHTLTSDLITITVAGTIAEALAAGLMHPSCRHRFSAYLPGVTKPLTDTADPEGDAARQRLRAMERYVREWKRRGAGALTRDARDKAAAKVKHWQSEIAKHVEHTGLLRQRHREQVTVIDDSDPATSRGV